METHKVELPRKFRKIVLKQGFCLVLEKTDEDRSVGWFPEVIFYRQNGDVSHNNQGNNATLFNTLSSVVNNQFDKIPAGHICELSVLEELRKGEDDCFHIAHPSHLNEDIIIDTQNAAAIRCAMIELG